jgi:hypothetical protein
MPLLSQSRQFIKYLLLVMLFSLCIAAFYFGAAPNLKRLKIPKPPLEVPFSLDRGGECLEFEIRIVKKYTYTFGLGFIVNRNNPSDWSRVLKITGSAARSIYTGKYVNLGEPLNLRLQVNSIDKNTTPFVFDKTESQILKYATGGAYIKKMIVNLLLEPGLYKVRLDNLLAAPAIKGTPINFHIRQAYLGK